MRLSPATRLLLACGLLAAAACVTVEIESPEGRDLVDRLPAAAVGAFGGAGEVPGYLRDAMPAGVGLDPVAGSLGRVLEEAGFGHGDLDEFAGAVLVRPDEMDADEPASPVQVVTLLRGSFDRDRMERALEDRPSTEHRGTRVYRLETFGDAWPAELRPPFAAWFSRSLAILDDDILVTGTPHGTRAVLDVEAGAASLQDDAEMMALIDEASGPDTTHWGVFAMERLVRSMTADSQVPGTAAARTFRSLVMTARVDEEGARGRVVFEARDETGARLQHEAMQGALATAKLGLGSSQPELVDVLDRAVRAELDGTAVRIEFDLRAEDVVTLQRASVERARDLLEGAADEDDPGGAPDDARSDDTGDGLQDASGDGWRGAPDDALRDEPGDAR